MKLRHPKPPWPLLAASDKTLDDLTMCTVKLLMSDQAEPWTHANPRLNLPSVWKDERMAALARAVEKHLLAKT